MDYESLEKKLIQRQNILIKQLEEQLAVYQEKDKCQELLIEKLNCTLDIFAEEISRLKAEKEIQKYDSCLSSKNMTSRFPRGAYLSCSISPPREK